MGKYMESSCRVLTELAPKIPAIFRPYLEAINGFLSGAETARLLTSPILKKVTEIPVYKTRIKLSHPLSTFKAAYTQFYDSQNWFMPDTRVTKILPYGELPHEIVLSVQSQVKTRKLFPSTLLSGCFIRTSIKLGPKRYLVLTKDIQCESFSLSSSITQFLSVTEINEEENGLSLTVYLQMQVKGSWLASSDALSECLAKNFFHSFDGLSDFISKEEAEISPQNIIKEIELDRNSYRKSIVKTGLQANPKEGETKKPSLQKLTVSELTEKQHAVYDEFKKLLRGKGIMTEDEGFILRCLKAKDFKLTECLNLAIRATKLRTDNNPSSITLDQVKAEYNTGMAIMIGKDKCSQPILLARLKLVNPKATTEERMKKFMFYSLEEAIRQMAPEVEKYTSIADFKGAGLSNMNLKQLKEMAPVIQDCYPERMHKLYIVNANWLLKIVWGVIKPFLDASTVNRINFVSEANMKETLLKDIDEDVLPKEYGGKAIIKFVPVN